MSSKFVLLVSLILMLSLYGNEDGIASLVSVEQIDMQQRLLQKSERNFSVLVSPSNYDHKSNGYITLRQVQGDNSGLLQEPQHKEENVIQVSLQKLVQEVVKKNASAIIDYLQAQISKEQIKAEEGIFEPILQASFNRQRIHVPNTTEEILTRQDIEYFENTDALEIGVNGIISSGAQWNFKFVDNRRDSSTIEKFRDYKYEYDNSLKLSLDQPLLKGFGKKITRAKIDLAKIQSDIDDNKFEQKLMELVGVTIQLYWKLYGAQKIYQSWEKSLKIAEDSLKDIELRAMSGKIAKTEFMEAQSSINVRRGELYNAKNKVVEAQNQLMTLLNVSVSDNKDIQLIAVDEPFGSYDKILESDEYVKIALGKWPEYKIAQKTLEKERILVEYAQNQLLPQMNIIGTVSTNSLERENEKALRKVMDDKFLSWSIGIKVSMPLLNNVQAKSSLLIAKMRVNQADIELDAFVKSLSNSLHSKVNELKSSQEQLKEYLKGLDIKAQLLEIEQIKLKSGRIGLKDILSQEEDYINYQRKVLSGVVNYKLAEASLEIAVGNILAKYHINLKDIHYPDVVLSTDLETILK